MATIAVVLKTKQKLSNGEFAVALRVTHDRHSRFIVINTLLTDQSLKLRCRTEEWKPAEAEDNGLGRFRKTFKGYKECNAILETKLAEAHKILRRYESEGIAFDFIQFETDLKRKEEAILKKETNKSTGEISLQDNYTQQIQILEEQGRVGLAGLYLEVQLILKKFKPDIWLSDINIRFLESFEYWMRNQRGNKDTTISVKMRNLQRVINQAIDDKLFNPEYGETYGVNLYKDLFGTLLKSLPPPTKAIVLLDPDIGIEKGVLKLLTSVHLSLDGSYL
ncbi:phage integrase SAM-like domain and Arm DNA-binding domain-containing protein [Mucilaginibacter sp. PAMB04168]|uniref:phage integrase SAM-like domain and Arm DNA-binding domain-containing protein n=1 Tax=Mucilaginibacter sp. PAMB04168 TaxID=3138567 RepID=UPI0031F63B8B